jgi:nucleoside-diphosphate-sugar epimerase
LRRSADFVAEKRRHKKNVILLTGATGFLGSHMAVQLLKKGHFVILLCRPKDGLSAEQRMRRIFEWFDFPVSDGFKVIDGQIVEPQFGLDDRTYAYLKENTDEVVHCVAETSFSEVKRTQLEAVNVQGTDNALRLAAESKCYFFHHMSTAYVAGQGDGLCKEEYVPQARFHNAYEETKHIAEGRVLETCHREGIRASIYRPSIVYGDSKSGKSLLFNAFYSPVRLAHYLKTIWEKDFAENEGRHAQSMGVHRTDDGWIHGRLRFERAETGTLNLITIDFLVDACLAIMEDCLDGGIFHLVNGRENTLDELLIYMRRFLKLSGIQLVPRGHLDHEPRNAVEKLVSGYMDVYQPYFFDDRTFDWARAERVLARNRIACPRLDYHLFSRCVEYAIQVDWGKRLFENGHKPLE